MYWNTVNSQLKECLLKLMQADELSEFRLVGGTALSLYLGHRMSIDIDLFTDAPYRSVDFDTIEAYLQGTFEFVTGGFGGNPGMGKSYLIGADEDHAVKVDLYYSMDPFFQDIVLQEGVRMASVEEVIAMKVDVVQRVARKKDFWHLHELLPQYSVAKMIDLHRQRFEWTHDEALIRTNLTAFDTADDDFDPICLRGKHWVFIKEDLEQAVSGQ